MEEKRTEKVGLKEGFYPDIEVWLKDNDIHNKVLRYWSPEQLEPDSDFPECSFIFISQIIDFGNDFYIGYQVADSRYETGKYPYIDYDMLSNMTLAYCESDQHNSDNW